MIIREIKWRQPLRAFAPLAGEPWAHLLHGGDLSVSPQWSIIVAFPTDKLVFRHGMVRLNGALVRGGLFGALGDLSVSRRCIAAAPPSSPASPAAPAALAAPFKAGLIGFAGYETAGEIEPGLDLPSSPFPLPDAAFGAYDAAALFNRKTLEAWITGRDEKACDRLEHALGADVLEAPGSPNFSAITSNFDRRAYEKMVAGVISSILEGDIFQANIAQQFFAHCKDEISGFDLFRVIAAASDAHHGALLQFEEGAIISNSPERFFKTGAACEGPRRIVVEPVKGTRPRGGDAGSDIALAEALLRDPKDRAENIMIADLMRNDLSKICLDHSIREEEICALMSLSMVHHLVSRISGDLAPGAGPEQIFKALFPSGSITGAPKVEAMKKIAAAEKIGRGPYCGAIGYIGDDGAMDFSVAIRTLMLTRQEGRSRATFPAGGGVTLGSKPSLEYEETLVKAESIRRALSSV